MIRSILALRIDELKVKWAFCCLIIELVAGFVA